MADPKRLVFPIGSEAVDLDRGSIFFVGTATVILRFGGFTVLTDPNFLHAGDHVHLGYGLRSKRLTNPAIELRDLPPLDMVVLSHLHEDHFDRKVQRELDKKLPIVTTPEAAEGLLKKGFSAAVPLATWETVLAEKGKAELRITAMPGRHGPPVLSKLLPQVMGSLLEFSEAGGKNALRLYLSGDTLVYDDLREIPRRHPEIDLMLLHLGGTRIVGVLVTMDGKQGVEAIRIIKPRRVVPIHYDDYTVFKSPLSDFIGKVRAAGLEDRVTYLARGETYSFEVSSLRGR